MHTTSMHRLSDATPGDFLLISRAASSPNGVAALPSPSRLADTLAATVSMTLASPAKSGYSRFSTGRSSRDSVSLSPERLMISMTPIHRHSTPVMDRQSSTAAAAPSRAPAATASMLPVTRPHTTAAAAMPAQMMPIVIPPTSCLSHSMRGRPGLYRRIRTRPPPESPNRSDRFRFHSSKCKILSFHS